MPVSDNNPERRNLTVASLSFITYFLAGGVVTDSKVNLQVVNVSFSRPDVLSAIAWSLLFWFALRYWQVNRGKVKATFVEELKSIVHSKQIVWFIKHKTGKAHRVNGGFQPRDFSYTNGRLNVRYGDVRGGTVDASGKAVNFSSTRFEQIPLSGFSGLCVKALSATQLAIIRPGIGNYFVPYLLFATAVILGFVHAWL